jgi:hypothetical protein
MTIDRRGASGDKPRAKRRLTIYPGQVSMFFSMADAKELYGKLTTVPNLASIRAKLNSAIQTAERLTAEQSAVDRGNF